GRLGMGHIFEEIYSLYKKWMDSETRGQWSNFLRSMSRHPLYQRIHATTRGTSDQDFQDLVIGMIDAKS
ncbi:MAG: hypothetical protein JRM86_00970, partial [Nitrososphaerota archaeon]|nr:hypothetical protein [Nitrososphaerota archaeon]